MTCRPNLSVASSSSSDKSEDEDPVYTGKRDHHNFPHGRGTLIWPVTGTRFQVNHAFHSDSMTLLMMIAVMQ